MLAFDYVKHSQVWRVLGGCQPHIKDSHTHMHTQIHTHLDTYYILSLADKEMNACVLFV